MTASKVLLTIAVACACTAAALAQPVNDICSGALPLSCGQNFGTITGASVDYPNQPTLICANTNDRAEYDDRRGVWYTWLGNGLPVTFSTCNASTTFDSQIVVFSGGCANLTCVAGNDDAGSTLCPGRSTRSLVTLNSTVNGDTYHVLVCPWSTSAATGDFVLDVNCNLPLDVTCTSPPVIPQDRNARLTATVRPGTGPTSTGITATINLTAIGGSASQAMSDDGVTGGDLIAGDFVYSYTALIPATQPLGPLSFGVSVSDAQARSDTCTINTSVGPPSPLNDDCIAAPVVACGSVSTSIDNATDDFNTGGVALICGNTNDQSEYNDRAGIWYRYVGTGAPVEFSTCNAGTNFDSQIVVFSGQCGAVQCVAGNDDAGSGCPGSGARSIVRANNLPLGQEFLIYVAPWNQTLNVGNVQLDVNCNLPLDISCLTPSPNAVSVGGNILFRARVDPGTNPLSTGIRAFVDLSSAGGSSAQPMSDDGTDGDALAGDGIYSYLYTVPLDAPLGSVTTQQFTTDDQQRLDGCAVAFRINAPPPANDSCSTAQLVSALPFSSSVDNSGANQDAPLGTCNSGFSAGMLNSVWYSFTPPTTDYYVVTVTTATGYGPVAAIFTGTCGGTFTEVACGIDLEPLDLVLQLDAGTQYYLKVGQGSIFPGGGETNVSIAVATGLGACCVGPASIPGFLPGTCITSIASACTNAGGRFQGAGSVCGPTVDCCGGDIDGDFDTDESDLGILLASWDVDINGDINGDGTTDESDLGILLSSWGCVVP